MEKSWKSFVCPFCFNRINNCVCTLIPQTLINIDIKIQYAIKILNQKGYITKYCCSGHNNKHSNGTYFLSIYITFADYINIKDLQIPENWTKKNNTNSVYSKVYYPKTKKEFDAIQKEELKKLNKWVDSLADYKS